MRVSVVGTGYVGLVTGACLAELGHEVVCVDREPKRLESIQSAVSPFYEPGLSELLGRVAGNTLCVSADLASAIRDTGLTLIAVGTPSYPDGSVDLGAIEVVSRQVGEVLRDKSEFHTVVVKSTVPPGTTENVVGALIEESSGKERRRDFGLGMNPEFLTEGTAVSDFRWPDRLVLGGNDERTLAAQRELYAGFEDVPVLEVGNSTAEMIKYMSNALLATMISFSNEYADLCTVLGDIDAADVQSGVHLSRYLTVPASESRRTAPIADFIEAGCGFGGSCLPKDVKGIASIGVAAGLPMRMMRAVLDINAERAERIVEVVRRNFDSMSGLRVALLGLSFRPDTNDMRESPAIPIAQLLTEAGCSVNAYDPQAMDEARSIESLSAIGFTASLAECIEDCDAIVIVTRWQQFDELPSMLAGRDRQPVVVDGRRMLPRDSVSKYDGPGL